METARTSRPPVPNELHLPLSTLRMSIADMMALRVRAESRDPAPKLLYQAMPERALSLIATIPRGTPAVSIPCDSYPISRSLPIVSAGFVIVYSRRQDGRYEAVEILAGGRSFDPIRFHEMTCKSVEAKLTYVSDRYVHLAPTKRAWEVIVRDGGYAAVDSSSGQHRVTPCLLQELNDAESCGLIVRAQLHAAYEDEPEQRAPVFARVEVTTVANYGRDNWKTFVEFQSKRSLVSRPPDPFIPEFRDWMQLLGTESNFHRWIFRKGMFFGDRIEWWGSRDLRRTEHEGLDFAEGIGPDGGIRGIPEGTPIRSVLDGEIAACLDDFLDKTIVVRHGSIRNENGDVFHTMYSHIAPLNGTEKIMRGELIGKMGKSGGVRAPSHLHLTCAWIPSSFESEDISMDHIHPGYSPVVLVNFNGLIDSTEVVRS